MGFFSRILGLKPRDTATESTIEPIVYKGFSIYAEAMPEGGQFRVAGRITQATDDGVKEHRFIRSDVVISQSDANDLMIIKAKMLIDQMGDKIFTA